ncbi:DNA-binding GntR family transcriptional regulator [Microbacterium resistens]|uniref:DNA-binding GntR family transcriptional regulator n=1 Tax=Microbacterium resistens TaxID=156977 RepID=A0ABU1SGW1_9MICO|nr:GntR family transcriptional regulator [Microbacterium resistens]MDR6868787.1 DNA-binding GntR family transcriptional regulator [Microbacterium resistens]
MSEHLPSPEAAPTDLASRREQPHVGKTEQVYRYVREAIEAGTFAPGQALPESVLVEQTGASRTPVREALRRLAADQLVEISPRRAPIVTRLSLRQARSLFDYRRVLEPAAVRSIVARLGEEPALAARFTAIGEGFDGLVDQPYSPAFADRFSELTRSFDETVVELTPNEYLARAIVDLRPHVSRLRRIAHADVGRLAESVREHIEMCRAIVDRDADRAAAVCTHHLFHVDQAIFAALLSSSRQSAAPVDIEA